MSAMDDRFASVDALQAQLGSHSYLADRGLATAIHLALSLDKPLLLEGEAGVGKTEVAKVLAELLGRRLIRLQCYEGIDASQALYEWNYARQLLAVRAMDASEAERHVDDLFGPEFLVERPLLAAIRAGSGAVLLVDELDRADDEFEAFLLEILSEFAVTIPEVGQIVAESPPAVVVTSNRTRELHDALKRRCLYHWIDHPGLDREVEIVRTRAPHVGEDARPRRRGGGRQVAVAGSRQAPRRRGDDRLGERPRVPRRRSAEPRDGARHAGCGREGPRGPGAGGATARRSRRRPRWLSLHSPSLSRRSSRSDEGCAPEGSPSAPVGS